MGQISIADLPGGAVAGHQRWVSFRLPSGSDLACRFQLDVDLGRIPPGLHATLDVVLPRLPPAAKLDRLSSSCGCLDTKLLAGDLEIPAGSGIPSVDEVRVHAVFAAKGANKRAGKETIRVALALQRAPSAYEYLVDLRYVIDPEASALLDRELCLIRGTIPITGLRHRIPLRRPMPKESIQTDETPWLRLVAPSSSTVDSLEFVLGPIDTNGDYETNLRFILSKNREEQIPITLRAEVPAGYAFSPSSVVLSLPAGGSLTHPVSLRGHDLDVAPDACAWEWNERGAARLSLTPVEQNDRLARFLFGVAGTETPGLHRGTVRVRPHPAADFRVALPFLVRVY